MVREYITEAVEVVEDHNEACIECGEDKTNSATLLGAGDGWRCSGCGLTVIENNGEGIAFGVVLSDGVVGKYGFSKR